MDSDNQLMREQSLFLSVQEQESEEHEKYFENLKLLNLDVIN